jgi:hypothetical protein
MISARRFVGQAGAGDQSKFWNLLRLSKAIMISAAVPWHLFWKSALFALTEEISETTLTQRRICHAEV